MTHERIVLNGSIFILWTGRLSVSTYFHEDIQWVEMFSGYPEV